MTDVGWGGAVVPIVAAAAVLLVPGLLVLAPLRLGWWARLALAGGVSIALIGVAGIAAGFAGMPFGWWQPLCAAAVMAGYCGCRCVDCPAGAACTARVGAPVAWAAAAIVAGLVAFALVPSASRVSQTYDNVFHLGAIASIDATGDASSLTLRTLIEPDKGFSFYPAGWHSAVVLTMQLTGATAPVASNATWIAAVAALWIPGSVWLATLCVRRASAASVAVPLTVTFGTFPYALLAWGTLYPTFLATCLLPAAVAAPIAGWRLVASARPARRVPVVAFWVSATAVLVAALALSQPRVVATWAVLVLVPVVAVAVGAVRRARARGGLARRRATVAVIVVATAMTAAAALATWYVVVRLGLFERPLEDRLGGPQAQAVQSIWQGIGQVLAQSALVGGGPGATFPAVLLALAVAVGAVVAWRMPRQRWIVASFAIVSALFIAAAGSDDIATKLATAIWYKDRFRLSSSLPVLGVTLATLGILAAARLARPRAGVIRRRVAIGLAWVVALVSAATVAATGMSGAIGHVFRLPDDGATDEVVSRAQIAFYGTLAEVVPADQRVLGDPWDGSAWTLLFGDREPVFPHVNGQWDADRLVLARSLAAIDTDPAVCEALDRLRVRYVVYSPHAFGGGDPAGNLFPGPHEAVEQGLFTLVATGSDTQLYRIDQCGPLP